MINLPLPPSKNKWLGIRNGRIFTTNAFKDYIRDCGLYLMAAGVKPIKEERRVIINIWVRKPRQNFDAHNVIPCLMDALQDYLGINDKWFLPRIMDFTIEPKNSGITIEII
jgi:hypothetical protein